MTAGISPKVSFPATLAPAVQAAPIGTVDALSPTRPRTPRRRLPTPLGDPVVNGVAVILDLTSPRCVVTPVVCSAVRLCAVGAVVAKPSDEVLALGSFSGGGVERCAFGVVGDPVEVRPAAEKVLGGATLPS